MTAENIIPSASNRMPTWFIPHGAGPCFFMDWKPPTAWDRMAGFLRGLAETLPARPRAIVVVSAHWLAPLFGVTGNARPDLIDDYAGFPPHTYALRYPAPGKPALADRVTALLRRAGMASRVDPQRGFDHGVFIPVLLIFPETLQIQSPFEILVPFDADVAPTQRRVHQEIRQGVGGRLQPAVFVD